MDNQQRTCRVVAVTNNKGGVGKTSSTVAIGSILQTMGYRVLLVDLDPQANMTTHLAGSGVEFEQHIGDVLAGSASIQDLVLTYAPQSENADEQAPEEATPGLDFVPSSYQLNLYEKGITKKAQYASLLRQALRPIRPYYDFILLDTPPTLQTYTLVSLVAADAYVIPAEPEKFSYDGVKAVIEAAADVKDMLNPSLELLGIFFTRYNPKLRNSTHDLVVSTITSSFGEEVMLPNVRKDAAMPKAQVAARTIMDFAPHSNSAIDYYALTAELLTRLP